MDAQLNWLYPLAVALAIGLLVGVERGFQDRQLSEGQRLAGLRTFGLAGLLGGITGLLSTDAGLLLPGLVFVGLAVLAAAGYYRAAGDRNDLGMTTEVALLTTLLLAVLAGRGQLVHASAGAVVMVFLLRFKTALHGWLKQLRLQELTAGIQLLLISVVLLPLLPNRGFGPWSALNPFEIWWMVVLIAALSFFGYFAIRIAGPRAGIAATGVFGGIASSTATTLNLARLGRRVRADQALLAAGILMACGAMFPRMLLVATLVYAPLLDSLWLPVVVMSALTWGSAALFMRRAGAVTGGDELLPGNPLALGSALAFGGLLALVILASRALTEWFGQTGVWALAAASGVADVDAITLSLARMSQDDLASSTAAVGIVIAATVNSLAKAGLAWGIGGRALGLRVGVPLAVATVAGLVILLAT